MKHETEVEGRSFERNKESFDHTKIPSGSTPYSANKWYTYEWPSRPTFGNCLKYMSGYVRLRAVIRALLLTLRFPGLPSATANVSAPPPGKPFEISKDAEISRGCMQREIGGGGRVEAVHISKPARYKEMRPKKHANALNLEVNEATSWLRFVESIQGRIEPAKAVRVVGNHLHTFIRSRQNAVVSGTKHKYVQRLFAHVEQVYGILSTSMRHELPLRSNSFQF